MKIRKTKFAGAYILEPKVFEDERGWFLESYRKDDLEKIGFRVNFVQDNHSKSNKRGTLRGLHLQKAPFAQAKLIRCTRGKILDVIVDLRKKSPTYKKWHKFELSEKNKRQVLIPRGFAHGYLTLEPNSEIEYKVDNYYDKNSERSIRFDDPQLKINWGTKKPILSDKDAKAPYLKDCDI